MAVAGVLVAGPQAQHLAAAAAKPNTVAQQLVHAELDAKVGTTEQAERTGHVARTYTVQPSDTLSNIADRFYGQPSDWSWLYHVNQPEIHNPNLIYAGEELKVPTDRPARPAAASTYRGNGNAGNTAHRARHAKATSVTDTTTHRFGSSVEAGSGATQLSGMLSCGGLEELWQEAGGSPSAEVAAASIAMAESGGSQYATGSVGERGYWQINPVNGALSTYDPYGNARAAVIMSDDGNDWSPWTTFETGAYIGRC